MNRTKYLYALLVAALVVTSGCLVAATADTITRQWVKHFWVREPRLPVECEIEIEGPKVAGHPVNISVTLRIEDEIDSLSGNLTVDLYWYNWTCHEWEGWYEGHDCHNWHNWHNWHDCHNWTANNWQHIATLLEETEVTITQEEQTWLFTTTPERTGLYKVVVTFTTETGTESFTSKY